MPAPEEDEELLQNIAEIIDEHYERVENIRDLESFLGTDDIYEAIQNIFPSGRYNQLDLTYILMDHGFSFAPVPGPGMQYAWMIRPR